jgi:hypothetical protein
MRELSRGAALVALLVSGAPAFAADLPTLAASPVDPFGDNFFGRLYHAYADEWGKDAPVTDPRAAPLPPARRGLDQIAPQPETSPPYPFVEWPFGGASTIGGAIPNAVDTPLQKALLPATSAPGKWLEDQHIQVYGWVTVGGNVSTAKTGYGGNAPAAYSYSPNQAMLDQAVLYVERVPDTVQQSHWDWGFRVSGIYGENYRYTTALGVFSNQYVYHNHFEGYDMPMVYGELYLPQFAEGLLLRAGRYISVPDIEAQLAPNNYMYSHSMTYALDNYTNTGLIGTLKITKNWLAQFGVSAGTETVPWNAKTVSLPGYTGQRDPGTQPSFTGCLQYQTDSGNDNFYGCANGINNGTWGYNNLQWYGGTIYHKFNDQWHISFESYYEYEKNVLDVTQGYANTAFQYMTNAPLEAHCQNGATQCTAQEYALLAYLNYKIDSLNNLSLRGEFYNDEKGQRTGYTTRYFNQAFGWQHWFSPSVEIRPEIAWYHSLDQAAFDNGTKHEVVVVSSDLTWHF